MGAEDRKLHAQRALAEAVDLARTQDARLTLVTVAAPLHAWPGYVPPISEADLDSAAEQILAEGEALVPEGIPGRWPIPESVANLFHPNRPKTGRLNVDQQLKEG